MITINGRKLIIPKIDAIIGWQGDNLVETRTFELEQYYNNIDLSLLDFKIDILSGETTNIIDLDKDLSVAEKVTLTWTIQEAHLANEGLAKIQVRGLNGTLVKWHSDIEYIMIKKSINASEIYLNPLPSEFDEMEVRITAAKNTAIESKDLAIAAAAAALLSETNAKASENAAKLSETNAKTSEDAALLSKTNAKASEDAAKISETNAKTSEDAALLSKTNAKASEDAAKLSETNAKNSETAAANQAGIATAKALEANEALSDFLAKANGIFNVSTTQPTYGLWIEEVI